MANTLNGIDIASYQAGIDFSKMSLDFVFIKTTEGTSYLNPDAKAQFESAKQNKLLTGCYHFATSQEPIEQAKYFVKQSQTYINEGAVPVLDYEADGLKLGPSGAKKFMDYVYKETGVRCMIYMSKDVCSSQDWKDVAPDYKLWVAQYADMKTTGWKTNPWTDNKGYGAWNKPSIFQYTSSGVIDGWTKTKLDLDIFYGSADDFKKLGKVSKDTSDSKDKVESIKYLKVDGYLGIESVKRLQEVLKCKVVDGIISGQLTANKKFFKNLVSVKYEATGSTTVKKLQAKLGVKQDGYLGPITIRILQTKLNVKADGYVGPETAKALQTNLNKNKVF